MDDTGRVRRVGGLGDLAYELDGVGDGKPSARTQLVCERAARHELHCEDAPTPGSAPAS